ncbi:MAG: hypothetical protein K6E83_12890 [Clostridium sp.]|nr:hypothetical protein [Clostridium sp.]
MKHRTGAWVLAAALALSAALPAAAENVIQINGEETPLTREETIQMVQEATEAFYGDEALNAELAEEIREEVLYLGNEGEEPVELTIYTLTHNGQSMRFRQEIRGEPDENGYPLYIALHGGGGAPAEDNDLEWDVMAEYYPSAIQNGIYVAVRSITDTWDLHFRPESYPMYDRLIQAMIRLCHADPNRVYLLGFSAGGDGVYQIAPRMADRFAAANMSSGHPNGVSLRNLANLPFSIQVGLRDYYTEDALRSVRGAEFDAVLNGYHDLHDYGYEHQVLVRVPAGHNYNDITPGAMAEVVADPAAFASPEIVEPMLRTLQDAYAEACGTDSVMEMSYAPVGENPVFDETVREITTEEFHLETWEVPGSAVEYVSRFTRNPIPPIVEWDLGTRTPLREMQSFYWLRADPSVTEGTIFAEFLGDNRISVTPEGLNGDFSILVNPRMLDVSEPIHISTPDGEFTVKVNPSAAVLDDALRETGDPSLAWVAEIPYSQLH